MKYVNNAEAPKFTGLLSQASVTERPTVYVSGQVGIIPGTNPPKLEDTAEGQTYRALGHLETVLVAAGSSIGHIVMLHILHTDQAEGPAINAAYQQYMQDAGIAQDELPPRTATGASFLPMDAKVEIYAIGELANNQ